MVKTVIKFFIAVVVCVWVVFAGGDFLPKVWWKVPAIFSTVCIVAVVLAVLVWEDL